MTTSNDQIAAARDTLQNEREKFYRLSGDVKEIDRQIVELHGTSRQKPQADAAVRYLATGSFDEARDTDLARQSAELLRRKVIVLDAIRLQRERMESAEQALKEAGSHAMQPAHKAATARSVLAAVRALAALADARKIEDDLHCDTGWTLSIVEPSTLPRLGRIEDTNGIAVIWLRDRIPYSGVTTAELKEAAGAHWPALEKAIGLPAPTIAATTKAAVQGLTAAARAGWLHA